MMTISLRKALLLTLATTGLLGVSGVASDQDILAEVPTPKASRSASVLPTASSSNGVSVLTQNGVQKPKKNLLQRLFPCCTKHNLAAAAEVVEELGIVAAEVLKVIGTETGNNELIEAGNITAAGEKALHNLAQDLSTKGIHAPNVPEGINEATATIVAAHTLGSKSAKAEVLNGLVAIEQAQTSVNRAVSTANSIETLV